MRELWDEDSSSLAEQLDDLVRPQVGLETRDSFPNRQGLGPAEHGVDKIVELAGELSVGQRVPVVAGGKASSWTSSVPSSSVTLTRFGIPAG